jgi:hypothetical protein
LLTTVTVTDTETFYFLENHKTPHVFSGKSRFLGHVR